MEIIKLLNLNSSLSGNLINHLPARGMNNVSPVSALRGNGSG